MPIYRVIEPRLGRLQVKEWRRRALRTLGLLILALVGCTVGLFLLDSSDGPLTRKVFTAVWNAANLVTTLGDFTGFNEDQKTFMIGAMFTFLIIGGYAVSQLTGMLSSDAVMAHRENRSMKRTLDHLANHIIVIGFGALGRLVAGRLQAAGDLVVVIEKADDLAVQASELGYLVVQGDAGVDDSVLDRARVDRARALVVTIEDRGPQAGDYVAGTRRQPEAQDRRDRPEQPAGGAAPARGRIRGGDRRWISLPGR